MQRIKDQLVIYRESVEKAKEMLFAQGCNLELLTALVEDAKVIGALEFGESMVGDEE